MSRFPKVLPSHYQAEDIIGVTRGAMKIRPTVYFRSGSHFTQSHKADWNIGYHAPPPRGHCFFGNIPQAPAMEKRKELAESTLSIEAKKEKWREYLAGFCDDTNKKISVQPTPIGASTEGLMLLELFVGGGNHPSRSALEPVSADEARALFEFMKSRTTEVAGPHEDTKEYYFAPLD